MSTSKVYRKVKDLDIENSIISFLSYKKSTYQIERKINILMVDKQNLYINMSSRE